MEQEHKLDNDSQMPVNELDVGFCAPESEMSQPVPLTKDEFKLSISQKLSFQAFLSKGKL
jgi:hypothetical protein